MQHVYEALKVDNMKGDFVKLCETRDQPEYTYAANTKTKGSVVPILK